jgi:hypothetical protein
MKSSEKQIEKIDQLFKNKLDDHSIAPSENAWAKVEAGLSKKNKLWLGTTSTVVLWRMAAAVLLIGALLSVVYWSQTSGETEKVLAKKPSSPNKPKQEAQPTMEQAKIEQPSQKKNEIRQKENVSRFANNARAEKPEVVQEQQPSESRKKIIEIEKEIAQNSFKLDRSDPNPGVTNGEKIKEEATPQAEVASTKQKPIKLEFTLEALSSEETVATTTEGKSTGIKKVLNLAREVKQGEGLSGLREKKDELLAHNFLTKRERNQ